MNKQKLGNIELHSNIHTISINSTEQVKKYVDGVTHIKSNINEMSGEVSYNTKINLNIYNKGEISHYSDYQKIIDSLVKDIGVNEYHLARVDFKIDSYENNYDELLKLNKLVILLISISCRIKNRYQSFDPLLLENLTVRVQNEYLEAENYNKAIESNNTDISKNRLELRTKALLKTKKQIPELLNDWLIRLDNLPLYFEQLQSMCNFELECRWQLEKGIKVKSLSEFIRKYQENIYTSRQLSDLYMKLGIVSSEKSAYNFKSKSSIEYISKNDIGVYIHNIKNSISDFTH